MEMAKEKVVTALNVIQVRILGGADLEPGRGLPH